MHKITLPYPGKRDLPDRPRFLAPLLRWSFSTWRNPRNKASIASATLYVARIAANHGQFAPIMAVYSYPGMQLETVHFRHLGPGLLEAHAVRAWICRQKALALPGSTKMQ